MTGTIFVVNYVYCIILLDLHLHMQRQYFVMRTCMVELSLELFLTTFGL